MRCQSSRVKFKQNSNFFLKRLKVDPNFVAETFIDNCPANLTGADFYSITNQARQNALKRLINELETLKIDASQYNSNIVITKHDFETALESFVPTLSDSTLTYYEKYFSK